MRKAEGNDTEKRGGINLGKHQMNATVKERYQPVKRSVERDCKKKGHSIPGMIKGTRLQKEGYVMENDQWQEPTKNGDINMEKNQRNAISKKSDINLGNDQRNAIEKNGDIYLENAQRNEITKNGRYEHGKRSMELDFKKG